MKGIPIKTAAFIGPNRACIAPPASKGGKCGHNVGSKILMLGQRAQCGLIERNRGFKEPDVGLKSPVRFQTAQCGFKQRDCPRVKLTMDLFALLQIW